MAVLCEALTDNRNRTAADVRAAFSHSGGNLGTSGSVAFQFDRKGQIMVSKEVETGDKKNPIGPNGAAADEEEFMLAVAEAGGDDYEDADEEWIVYTAPGDLMAVVKELEAQGVAVKGAEMTMIANTPSAVSVADAKKVMRLIDKLEELEDLQAVYHTMDITDEIAEAVAESGIKANIARGATLFGEDFDFETHPACRELVALKEKWDGYDNGRIRVEASVHGEYTSDYRLWDALSEFAINEKVGMHVHLSETKAEHEQCLERNGLTPAQVLDCHHVFDTRAIAAHCVWVTPEDMRLLAKRGVTAVHCPVSNLKLASGCAPVTEMVKAGMNVALGTDSSASNNNLDLFEEMKAAALMAKVTSGDPKALPVEAVLMMATVCGARAQGREAECGMLKLGMDADLVLLDFTSPHLMPCHNVMSHLVYAASGHDVVMTMVRGQVLYAAGKYPTIDLDSVVRELSGYVMPRIFEEARS